MLYKIKKKDKIIRISLINESKNGCFVCKFFKKCENIPVIYDKYHYCDLDLHSICKYVSECNMEMEYIKNCKFYIYIDIDVI